MDDVARCPLTRGEGGLPVVALFAMMPDLGNIHLGLTWPGRGKWERVMRSSSAASRRGNLSVVPKAEASTPVEKVAPAEIDVSDGTDLSLPPDIASPLESALRDGGFRLERADTSPLGDDNIRFHRIRGTSASGASEAALLYVDDRRLDMYQEPWFVYSLCIRVCKKLRTSRDSTFGIVFLAPGSTRVPDIWKQQAEDFGDLGVATTVDFRSAGSPARWKGADSSTAMQHVQDWLRNLDIRPLNEPVTDGFDRPRERPAVPDPPRPLPPVVFISYAHVDRSLYTKLRAVLGPLDNDYPGAIWADVDIEPGADWSQTIASAIAAAPVVLAMVSGPFLTSTYIHYHELPPVLEAVEKREKTILWVYAGTCRYEGVVGKWQAAHDITQPLDRLERHRLEDELYKVYDAVEKHLRRLRGPRT